MAQVIAVELDPEFGGVEVWGKDHVDYLTGEYEAERDFWSWDNCRLMAFTGLTSTHAQEIYQDDIVKIVDEWSGRITAQVTWGEKIGMTGWNRTEAWILQFSNGSTGLLFPYCRGTYHLSIIGNVHEHPELLQSAGMP
jgi:uncharacterized phage protein (TIGR01671 family)